MTNIFIFILSLIIIVNIIFHLFYRFKRGAWYTNVPRILFKNIHIVPHPFLPYAHKRNFLGPKETKASYKHIDLNLGATFPQLKSNNYRKYNGHDGSRDVVPEKPSNLIRIHCIGASTTGNYIRVKEENISYPICLEKILNETHNGNFEVNNFGVGGWTSAELLVDFCLNNIDLFSDYLIIYHAYNDLKPSMTPNFKTDYSHSIKSFGESYIKYKILSKIPSLPLGVFNYFSSRYLGLNIRHSIGSATSNASPDYQCEFKGINTYRRNIESIITLCKAKSIKVVLSTFCYFEHENDSNDVKFSKLRQGVLEENRVMQELSQKHDTLFVDNAKLIPNEKEYFVDSIHFSPSGMKSLAKNFSDIIVQDITNSNYDK